MDTLRSQHCVEVFRFLFYSIFRPLVIKKKIFFFSVSMNFIFLYKYPLFPAILYAIKTPFIFILHNLPLHLTRRPQYLNLSPDQIHLIQKLQQQFYQNQQMPPSPTQQSISSHEGKAEQLITHLPTSYRREGNAKN